MVIDTQECTVSYANAAHPYGLMIGSGEDIIGLEKGCLPLGIFGYFMPEKEVIPYKCDTNIFLYSDGIYELLLESGLDMEYIIHYVIYYGSQVLSAATTLDKLAALIEVIPRQDDISLVYLKLSKEKT